MILLFFSLSYLTLIVTFIVFLLFFKYNRIWYRPIPVIGIMTAGFLAYFPLKTSSNIVVNILTSILDAWGMFVLKGNYQNSLQVLESTSPDLLVVYNILFLTLHLIAPICTTIVILSFIGDTLTKIRIGIWRFPERYVFNSLNEKTVTFASTVKEQTGKGQYIFCNTPENSRKTNPYYIKAKQQGFIIVNSNIVSIKPSLHSRTRYMILSDNEDEDLSVALYLIDRYRGYRKIGVTVLSNEMETATLLDAKYSENQDNTINIRLLNEPQLIAYELLSDNPLYFDAKYERNNTVSMLLIGAGYTGIEILKTALWCSRAIDDFSFSVTVVDKDNTKPKGVFLRDCPEISLEKERIHFYEEKLDADTASLPAFIEKENGRFNYIVISTNDDEVNIRTAVNLHSWYLRKKYVGKNICPH